MKLNNFYKFLLLIFLNSHSFVYSVSNNTILGFVNGGKYKLNEQTTFVGIALDENGNKIKKENFIWRTHYRHDDHWHDSFNVANGDSIYNYQPPARGDLSPNVFFRIQMITPFSATKFDTVNYDIFPKTVSINFKSNVKGINVKLLNLNHRSDTTAYEVDGGLIIVDIRKIQTVSGVVYTFTGWSDNSKSLYFNFELNGDVTLFANFIPDPPISSLSEDSKEIDNIIYPTILKPEDFTIYLKKFLADYEIIKVYNSLGSETSFKPNEDRIDFNNSLQSGLYYITFTDIKNKKVTHKFYKQ